MATYFHIEIIISDIEMLGGSIETYVPRENTAMIDAIWCV